MNEKSLDLLPWNPLCGNSSVKSETETSLTELDILSNMRMKRNAAKGVRKKIHSPEEIATTFRYENGELFFRQPGPRRNMNKPAGSLRKDGYIAVNYDHEGYKAHRIVWVLHNGCWPTEQMDHLNGDRSDNRIENLREVTHRENSTFIRKSNLSGVVGVSWNKSRNKWVACIVASSKHIHLGYFDSFFEACCARKSAEIRYGFPSGN